MIIVTLLETPPTHLPSISLAGQLLLLEIQKCAARVELNFSQPNSIQIQNDIRRWWSLSLTLVSQQAELEALSEIMKPKWKNFDEKDFRIRSDLEWVFQSPLVATS